MYSRAGFQFVTKLPRGQHCVSMVTHKNRLYVATNRHVFRLIGLGTLVPLQFRKPK